MPQCCSDPQTIFAYDYEDGAPLASIFVDEGGVPGTTNCSVETGHGINGSKGLHSDHTTSAGRFAEAYLIFPTNLDMCGNARKEFAVGGYWNFANTYSNDAAPLMDVRDTRLIDETLISLNTDGADLVVYAGQPPTSDIFTSEVYRVLNVITYGTNTFRRIEMRGSISNFDDESGWVELRIDGVVYENGADASQVDPDDPPPDCPTGVSGFPNFSAPTTPQEESGYFSAWDKVGIYPQGDHDCTYVKEVAAYCNMPDPNRPVVRCPPPGPGGSSFSGTPEGPRVVQGGGFTNWTYTAPPRGGVPATNLDQTDAQSLVGATDITVTFDLTLCDASVVSFGQASVVATSRPYAQPLVRRFGPVEYPLSDRFGNYRGQVWEVDLADPSGTLRGYLESATNRFYKRWFGHLYAESETARVAGTERRSLALGRVVSVTSPDDLVIRLTMADEFSRQDSPYSIDRVIPHFTVGDLFYIGADISATGITFLGQTHPTKEGAEPFDNPPQDVRHLPLPAYYGECSDDFRWAENPPITPIGICKPILIGDVLLNNGSERWQMYLASQYALYDITAMFGSNQDPNCPASVRLDLDALTDQFLIPKHGNWSSYFATNYIDVRVGPQEYRMTFFFARGPVSQAHVNGEVPISFNCIGIETIGDSLGTPIDDIAYVCQHFLDHPVIQKTLTGNWNAVSGWLQTSSFARVQAIHAARLTARYPARLIIDSQRTAKEWLAEILISGDMRLGVNHHGQLYLTAFDDSQDLSALTTFTDVREIGEASFHITSERSSELENKVRYDWGPEPATGRTTGDLRPYYSAESIRNWGDEYPAIDLHFLAVGSQAMADDVAQRRIVFTRDGITRGEMTVDTDATAFLPGTLIRATDFRGLGASGWSDRILLVDQMVLNPNVSNPPQQGDLSVTIQWIDRSQMLLAPAGIEGGGITADGTTTQGYGFAPLGSSASNTGWVLGSSVAGTGWRLRPETPVSGTGGIDMPVTVPEGSG